MIIKHSKVAIDFRGVVYIIEKNGDIISTKLRETSRKIPFRQNYPVVLASTGKIADALVRVASYPEGTEYSVFLEEMWKDGILCYPSSELMFHLKHGPDCFATLGCRLRKTCERFGIEMNEKRLYYYRNVTPWVLLWIVTPDWVYSYNFENKTESAPVVHYDNTGTFNALPTGEAESAETARCTRVIY